ncbi:MAG: S8 family serine peptidase [Gammaproteobacteria bacterium]|nr:S8 family serine peptidase [Gammaproteobacteria bacterium]
MKKKIFKSARWGIFIFIVISLLAALGGSIARSSGQQVFEYGGTPPEGPPFVPGEILVKFKPGIPAEVVERVNAQHGASILKVSRRGCMRVRIPKGRTIDEMIQVYSRNPNVEYALPNSICRAVMTPNDPLYPYQWHLDNPEFGGINMEQAWELSTGAGVVVAVLDTGAAYENYGIYQVAPDLAVTNFVPGYDVINDDYHPNDDNAHGTHVTGTIAQSTNNALGVAGVAFNASIMPVKVLDSQGSGTAFDVAEGLYYAADNGADVINMSLAWPYYRGRMYDPGPVVHDAVIYAYTSGVTIVAAAGNDGKKAVAYPAAYPECIAVGATQYDESLAPYTNKGSDLDLTAPGGNVNVDLNGDGYGDGVLQQTFDPNTKDPADFGYWFFQGTSMASPHVAGVVALVIAAGVSGPENVRNVLQSTAEDHGTAGWDTDYGWGIVDAYAALTSIGQPNQDPVADPNGPYSGTEDSAIAFDGSGSSDPDEDPLTYTWDFGDGDTGSGVSPSHTYLWGGAFTVSLTVNDGRGGTDTVTTFAEVTEVNDPPIADANGPYSGVVDEPIVFDGSGSSDFDNQDGNSANDQVLSYSWDFGDSSSGTGVNPTHSYSAKGTFTVTLTVSDGTASSASTTSASVTEQPVGVSVTGIIPNSVVEGDSINVTISGSGFQSGASVSLEGGSGPAPKVVNVVVVDSSTITATIQTKKAGPPSNRYWDVRVTNPDSSTGVLVDGFIVIPI